MKLPAGRCSLDETPGPKVWLRRGAKSSFHILGAQSAQTENPNFRRVMLNLRERYFAYSNCILYHLHTYCGMYIAYHQLYPTGASPTGGCQVSITPPPAHGTRGYIPCAFLDGHFYVCPANRTETYEPTNGPEHK